MSSSSYVLAFFRRRVCFAPGFSPLSCMSTILPYVFSSSLIQGICLLSVPSTMSTKEPDCCTSLHVQSEHLAYTTSSFTATKHPLFVCTLAFPLIAREGQKRPVMCAMCFLSMPSTHPAITSYLLSKHAIVLFTLLFMPVTCCIADSNHPGRNPPEEAWPPDEMRGFASAPGLEIFFACNHMGFS